MSGFVAVWPETGRCEVYGAFADTPNLLDRGMSDGIGDLYARMHERGELVTYAGRVVPPGEFLKACAARLVGERVLVAGADRFRRAAVITALDAACRRTSLKPRITAGHRFTMDGLDHIVRDVEPVGRRRYLLVTGDPQTR